MPGASLAVRRGDELFETAAGVVNRETGVEATPDAVFQIGSITKLWTASLVMQLVDEGRIDLDAPVRELLPELELGSAEAARTITMRQLLTHTSGIDGDFFQEAGRGDDCVERYVLACSGLGQLHDPGALFSYCNAGFVLAGRVVEKLRGQTWDDALQEFLVRPLGDLSLHTRAERLLYHRAAIGHVPGKDGELELPRQAILQRSNGPAGATPFAAARDLLPFAWLHLDGGVTSAGKRLLSARSVSAMQEPQVRLPGPVGPRAWGLGWMLFDWGGRRVIGHDGGTVGQSAFLRVVPDARVAVSLLTNGGNTAALYRRIFDAVLEPLCGLLVPALPEPVNVEPDTARCVGTYERLIARTRVEERDGKLWIAVEERRPLFGPDPSTLTGELVPVDASGSTFHWLAPGSGFRNYVSFIEPDASGRARFAHAGSRSAPRVV